ncbi:MAG: glycosyl transferase family 2 [Leptolyngbya foveolarum]|uniref:Glycosyl transferase family 2 n=1 Tax=Leptolyngbya foveolarum TaxID=47253 RepID=A0A2W4UCA6_9CYAN|nr:MAG: glycosyl transferase family 2 [Leptolyngbya foveolarum]
MKEPPLVSIIMIFFNGEKFIQEAIESVLAQTYQNWELLLVDDGSTDDSTDHALDYARQYTDKMRYLEHSKHQNFGMSAARNLGLQHAKGEYLIFLDCDDVLMPRCLETLLKIFSCRPEVSAAYGNTLYWFQWSNGLKTSQMDRCDQVAEATIFPNTEFPPPSLLELFLNNGDTVPCICSLMIRHDFMKIIGGFEESFRGLYEDQVFYAKISLKATIFVTDECLSKYRQHSDSCCAAISDQRGHLEKRLLFLNWLKKYLLQEGKAGTNVWKILQAELFSYRYPRIDLIKKKIQGFLWKYIASEK